ncbi:hypothetical protein AGMMS50276_04590 [Synergistales bacterium]|nr:hypothetical protein AGMMS50276_04590 [Synergistales bacterium]
MSYVVETIFLLLGVLSLYVSTVELEFWSGITPGGGFIPALTGAFLIIVALMGLIDKHKFRVHFKPTLSMFLPPLFILAALGVSYLVGMLPAIALMVFSWLKWVEKYSISRSTKITLILILFTYAIFRVWLRVLFPMGLLDRIF